MRYLAFCPLTRIIDIERDSVDLREAQPREK